MEHSTLVRTWYYTQLRNYRLVSICMTVSQVRPRCVVSGQVVTSMCPVGDDSLPVLTTEIKDGSQLFVWDGFQVSNVCIMCMLFVCVYAHAHACECARVCMSVCVVYYTKTSYEEKFPLTDFLSCIDTHYY